MAEKVPYIIIFLVAKANDPMPIFFSVASKTSKDPDSAWSVIDWRTGSRSLIDIDGPGNWKGPLTIEK